MTARPGNPPRVFTDEEIDRHLPPSLRRTLPGVEPTWYPPPPGDEPLRETVGYRDNPRALVAPAPAPPRPAWWRRALCALGLHQGGTPTTCCTCCESVCGP